MSAQGIIRRYKIIMDALEALPYRNLQELQEKIENVGLKASKRTLERDLDAIRNEFAVEIVYDHHKRGYFIDHEKSLAVDSFLRFLSLAETSQILEKCLRERKDDLQYIAVDHNNNFKGLNQLEPFLKAIQEKRKVRIIHSNFYGSKPRKYKIHPYLLKEYQNRWYISAWVSGLKQLRTFGLDRIEKVELLPEHFEYKEKLNPKEKFDDAIGIVYEGKKEEVILSFHPQQAKYIKTLPLHPSQKIIHEDKKECRISLCVVHNFELVQLILSHADLVKVIGPESLKEEVRKRVRKMNAFY